MALERRYPRVQIIGELGRFVQAVWRERCRGGTREAVVSTARLADLDAGTREVIVTADTPENLAAKLERPGWVPPG